METEDNYFDVSYKILLLGEAGVGKTTIIKKLTKSRVSMSYVPTVGIDFVKKIFDVDGAKVQLEIWDTAGQERFNSITRWQYRGSHGLVIVYDITDRSSFEKVGDWLESVDSVLNTENFPIILLANKCDLDDLRMVTSRQGKKRADQALTDGFYETSAKDNINILFAFQQLASSITEINNKKLMTGFQTYEERRLSQRRYTNMDMYDSKANLETISIRPKTTETLQDKKQKKKKKKIKCCHT